MFFSLGSQISEVPQPIAAKLCHMTAIWWQSLTKVRQLGGPRLKNFRGQKHAKFRSIYGNVRLWLQISPKGLKISKSKREVFQIDSSCVLRNRPRELWSTNFRDLDVRLDPLKCAFWGYYISALGRCCALREWPRRPNAHPNWDRGTPPSKKKIKSWKLKIGPKIQHVRRNNFRASRNIFAGLSSVDVTGGRGDKMGTIFTMPAPKNLWRQKNRPEFCAIFDNFRLWSRISPERINISKIDKALENLQPLPRWMKKSLCTLVHKRQSLFP